MVVRVLVSRDGRWRVDVLDSGRAEVREWGHLRATCREHELRIRLAGLGVDMDDLVED